jgi:DNA-binding transcriptional MerR regulator
MFFRVNQAAKILGIAPITLRRWDKQNIFPARRGPTGHRLYDCEDLDTIKEKICKKRKVENEKL